MRVMTQTATTQSQLSALSGVKQPSISQMLRDLEVRWTEETQGNCVFISATERRNIDGLRRTVLEKVRDLYRIRYPYKSDFYS